MNKFLKNIIEGNDDSPSAICLQSFNQNFPAAIHAEWFRKASCYEVIFYLDNLEHIALFSLTGNLTEYRMNIPPDNLPAPITRLLSSKGEIMNTVMRNKQNRVEYEVIVRDKKLNRTQITLSDIGKIMGVKKL